MHFPEQTLPWQLNSLAEVTAYVAQVCRQVGCSDLRQKQLELALDELFTNSVIHNSEKTVDGTASVTIEAGVAGDEVWFRLCDPGQAFDPTAPTLDTTDVPLSERAIGGLGLHFVRQVIERWVWDYQDNRNCVTLWASVADKVE